MNALLESLEPVFAGAFTFAGAPVTWFEIVAFVLALAMVLFNIRVNPVAWPLAIVSSLLYLLLFWRSRLYGDAALQVLFAVLGGWGWRQWLRGTDDRGQTLRVRRLERRHLGFAVAALALGWPATALFLSRYTDSDVPWWDGFTTAASILGQFLLGRKYVENWPTWLIVNVVATGLFAYKSLWLTALLYAIFALLSLLGWAAWRQAARPAAATSGGAGPSGVGPTIGAPS